MCAKIHRLPLSYVAGGIIMPEKGKYEFSEVKEMTAYPVINTKATGQNIQRLRMNAGLTVSNLQQIFGFSTPQAIYKWQRGTALPTLDNMVVLSVLFNTNINNILVYS